jgi:hypothetical protein
MRISLADGCASVIQGRSSLVPNIIGRIKDRVSWLSVIGALAYVVGFLARWRYVLELHHPRNYVYTDARQLTELAEVLPDPTGHQQFFHTIWPPGMSAFLALNLIFDPTAGSAAVCQLIASALVPLLVARAAHIAYGSRAGWVALMMASLHAGFIHYAGFFLSEQMCQLSVAIAVWTTVAALAFGETRERDASSVKRLVVCRIVTGIAAGLAWGIAFSLRPNALPVALLAAAWLAVRWLRQRRWSACTTLAAGAIAFFVVLAPLSHRCTSLVGNFCPGSSNGMMNVALGHAPDVAGLHFRPVSSDRDGGLDYWFPPARQSHGFQGTGEVEGSIYDNKLLLGWVVEQFTNDPAQFAIDSVGNVFDLFGSSYWPDDYGPLNKRTATVTKQAFFLLVLVPGMFALGLDVVRKVRRKQTTDVETFFVASIVGVVLVAAATMGEARYRIPFDTIFIILAARVFTQRREKQGVPRDAKLVRGSSKTAAVVLAIAAVLLVATAHPSTALAARLAPIARAHHSSPNVVATRSAAQLASPYEDGTPWDARGAFHRFPCRPDCPELRVDLEGTVHARSIQVSADANDRYEAAFYKDGQYVGRVAWGPFEGNDGLRSVRADVPKEASEAGYDTIAVRPLYGDNKYSVGYLRAF